MHLGLDQLHRGGQAKITEVAFREEISADLDRLRVFRDDYTILYGPELRMADPAVQVLAIKKLDGLRFSLPRRYDRRRLLRRILVSASAYFRPKEGRTQAEQHQDTEV